jgi:hypothetical protein
MEGAVRSRSSTPGSNDRTASLSPYFFPRSSQTPEADIVVVGSSRAGRMPFLQNAPSSVEPMEMDVPERPTVATHEPFPAIPDQHLRTTHPTDRPFSQQMGYNTAAITDLGSHALVASKAVNLANDAVPPTPEATSDALPSSTNVAGPTVASAPLESAHPVTLAPFGMNIPQTRLQPPGRGIYASRLSIAEPGPSTHRNWETGGSAAGAISATNPQVMFNTI